MQNQKNNDSLKLLERLAKGGHKVSRNKEAVLPTGGGILRKTDFGGG